MFTSRSGRRVPADDTAPRNPPTRREIARLLGYLRPYRRYLAAAVVGLTGGAALGLVFPWIMQNLVDAVLARQDLAELNRITLILVATFLARAVFYFLQNYALAYTGERIVVDLRRETYAHLHTLSVRFFSDRRVGELVSRLSSDVTLVRAALTNNVAAVLSQAITFLGSLVLMLVLNWRLTLFILALAPLVALSGVLFGRQLRKLSTTVQDQLADGTALAEEALSGVRVVKAFTREPYEAERYAAQMERAFDATMALTRVRAAFGPLVTFLGFGALAAVLWFGGREVLASRLTGGALIAFLVYGVNIAAALGSFTALYAQLQEALGASRRIFELLDEEPEIRDAPGARLLALAAGRLAFERVSFAYPAAGGQAAPAVLRDITLEIEPGEALALVGPSGAGKSTLFNLIPRFYDPTAGRVCVDGHDLRGLTLRSLRAQIGIVPQETHLFSGTVRENLLYGDLEASPAALAAAARAANAAEFIEQLPDGYDTLVGEKGVKLSGGQRQRIAIARALLKDPRLLLLDEATSSLDSESESLVQAALDRLMHGRTTVMIAHRLSTIHRANRIAVLDAGQLIELGAHAELLASGGLYARLYQLQFRRVPRAP
ncbi:MAG: ATP-binding cassette domain-containing protein [Anaerolineales bacterium]|nr:ATP-binding cassette domain-containing protein [Anaerolineales bacterium]